MAPNNGVGLTPEEKKWGPARTWYGNRTQRARGLSTGASIRSLL